MRTDLFAPSDPLLHDLRCQLIVLAVIIVQFLIQLKFLLALEQLLIQRGVHSTPLRSGAHDANARPEKRIFVILGCGREGRRVEGEVTHVDDYVVCICVAICRIYINVVCTCGRTKKREWILLANQS